MLAIRMEDHRPKLIEDGVPEAEQTMPINQSFWAFFTANLIFSNWVLGVLIVTLGMDFWSGLAVIIFGNALGALAPGLLSVMGPKTGLTQMEISRASFGKSGTRPPSFINWLSCIGWDAVNNIPAAAALVSLIALTGIQIPFWICLSILAFIQMLIGFYGHHLVQAIQKSLGYIMLVTFAVIGVVTIIHMGGIPVAGKPITLNALILCFGIIVSNIVGYAPYASDYTRYLPKQTSKKSIFGRVYLGLFFSSVLLQVFGLLTAGAVADATPQSLIAAITNNTGMFAPIALIIITLCSIPQNALNDNTGAYSLISAGIRIPRHICAIISALAAFALALYGSMGFASFLESFLLLLLYWIFPWVAILLVDWHFSKKTDLSFKKGWAAGATIWCIVTILTIALFPATDLYTGPIANMLGGVDLGYYVGFIAAGVSYWIVLQRKLKPKY